MYLSVGSYAIEIVLSQEGVMAIFDFGMNNFLISLLTNSKLLLLRPQKYRFIRARNFLSDKLVLQGKCSQIFTRPYEKFTCPASQE